MSSLSKKRQIGPEKKKKKKQKKDPPKEDPSLKKDKLLEFFINTELNNPLPLDTLPVDDINKLPENDKIDPKMFNIKEKKMLQDLKEKMEEDDDINYLQKLPVEILQDKSPNKDNPKGELKLRIKSELPDPPPDPPKPKEPRLRF